MNNLVGQKMGRYQIVEQLGEGGMATVYKGYDTTLQRNVAIKVIKAGRTTDVNFRKRFEREARALAQLSHPHIVHIHDFGEEGGLSYLVMDYISGGTLKTRMGRPMPYQEAAHLVMPVAEALGFAHQHKIIHRDIKPANILLTENGLPMLSDFGIAKIMEGPNETVVDLTSGMGVGTPAYMAPEQAGPNFDHRADIYALGIVFYELVTGRRPFDADTPLATLLMQATDPLPPPRKFVPSLPDPVVEIIYKALAKNPHDRFQSMEAFASQLAKLQTTNLASTMERKIDIETLTSATQAASQPQPVSSPKIPTAFQPPTNAPSAGPTPYPQQTASQQPSSRTYGQTAYPPTPVPAPAYQPQQKKSSAGKWIAAILALLAAGAVLLIAAAGGLYYFWPALVATRAPAADSGTADVLNQRMTALAREWGTVTAQAKRTPSAKVEPTLQAVRATGTQAAPSATPQFTSTAARQTAGAVDLAAALKLPRLAFFDNNDIWSVGLDGQNLVKLTSSGGDKRYLRWMPDGKSLYYISGKCIQTVDFVTRTESKLICFNNVDVQKVTGFEISPDGKYFGVLADDNLYLGHYDLVAMKKLTGKSALSADAVCGYLSGVRFFHLLGDDSKVAFTALAPGEDVVRIYSQGCGPMHNTYKQDEFPAERFRPSKFLNYPVIYNFAWNGLREYAMTTNYDRQHNSLGYFYLYNNDTKVGEQIKPLDSDCCYASPAFSYDGSYLTFGFVNSGSLATSGMQLYAVPYSDLDSGKKFDPIPLPANLLSSSESQPQPVIFIP